MSQMRIAAATPSGGPKMAVKCLLRGPVDLVPRDVRSVLSVPPAGPTGNSYSLTSRRLEIDERKASRDNPK